MLIWIKVNGSSVAIQAVKRGNTAYWRLAPYTIVYPTPKQREVRYNLGYAAHKSVDKPVEELNKKVKEQFIGWKYVEKKENRTAAALREIYGSEADRVLEYIDRQKRVSNIIKTEEVKKEIDNQIQLVLA